MRVNWIVIQYMQLVIQCMQILLDKYLWGVYYEKKDTREGYMEDGMEQKKEDIIIEETEETEMVGGCACTQKTKARGEKEYRDLMNRLKRIEGQVRGLQKMLEQDAYCTDILTQASAVSAALNSFNKALLTNHLHTCVVDQIRMGNDEVIDELTALLQKLMR